MPSSRVDAGGPPAARDDGAPIAEYPTPLLLDFSWGRVLVDPRRKDWLEARGYLAAEGPGREPARQVFFRSRSRENARRVDGPEGQELFDKRLFLRRAAATPALHEWHMLLHARSRGLRVPLPWAAGARRHARGAEAFLVLERLPGTALSDLAEDADLRAEAARCIARAVGRAVARLHAADLTFPSLFGKHVFADGIESASPQVGFLDLADARIRRRPGRRARARDLGALAATLPRRPVSRTLRLTALRAYLDEAGPGLRWSLTDAWCRIGRAARRHGRKRRHRRHLSPFKAPLRETAAGPALLVVSGEEPLLARHGGSSVLAADGPRGWTPGPGIAIFRGSAADARLAWARGRVLRLFDVPAPWPVALRDPGTGNAAALFRMPEAASPPAAPPSALEVVDLLLRLYTSGLLPQRGLIASLARTREGALLLPPSAPLAFPLRVRSSALRRSLRAVAKDLAALPWPSEIHTAVRSRLRREARRRALLV